MMRIIDNEQLCIRLRAMSDLSQNRFIHAIGGEVGGLMPKSSSSSNERLSALVDAWLEAGMVDSAGELARQLEVGGGPALTPAPLAPEAIQPSPEPLPGNDDWRFWIALSFAGEHRKDFILKVAKKLATLMPRERIFYDEWYEVELLGSNGDLKLTSMYEQARMVVPFFSEFYHKPWCKLEWVTLRGILLERERGDAVVPVHLDGTMIEGWPKVGFGLRLRDRSPEEIAVKLFEAYQIRAQKLPEETDLAG